MLEVQQYLIANPLPGRRPWRLINLVSHGNPYLGLSVKTIPDGKRASTANLRETLDQGSFLRMPEGIVDAQTCIEIHSCGIGENEALLDAVGQVFAGGRYDVPAVIASPHFEYYITDPFNEQVVRKFFADFRMISYRMGYKPPDRLIKKKFSEKYPDDTINWEEALKKETASEPGEAFYYTIDVPVKWVIEHDENDSLPSFETGEARLQWVKGHPQIIRDLESTEIPPEDFNWWFRHVFVLNEKGEKKPALWIKGYSTVLFVLQLLPPVHQEAGLTS